MNPYSGDMPIYIYGQRLTLAFDYAAIARIRAGMGNDGQARAMAGDVDGLPVLVAIGLARHHPEWTAAMVREASPPLMLTIKACEAAMVSAYFGPQGMPEEVGLVNPPLPPPTRATRLSRLWRWATELASPRPSCGP